MKWASPDEVLELLQQNPDREWQQRGAGVLQSVVEEWQKKKKTPKPEMKPSRFGKRFFFKASPPKPSFTGAVRDASNRRNCYQDGKRVDCEQRFGGQGQGWTNLRAQEDLYDALRRLVDEIKTGNHSGWHELAGLLVHTPVEDLQRLKQEHNLYAPRDVKQALAQRLQQELAHVGHQVQQQQPQQ